MKDPMSDTHDTHEQPPQQPPPPPIEPEVDEHEVNADQNAEEQVLCADTLLEGVDYLGEGYHSLNHYFRSVLEEHMDPAVHWTLDCVDWRQIRSKMEGDRYRYCIESGSVFRIELPAPDDPAAP